MAYEKQVWNDRQVTYPMRFIMTENADGTITLTPSPGLVTNEGTNVTAERLNHIEEGIYDLSTSADTNIVTSQESKTNIYVDGKQVYWKRLTGNLKGGGSSSQSSNTDFPIGYSLDEIDVVALTGYCINTGDQSQGNLIVIPSGVNAQPWFDMTLSINRDAKAVRVQSFGTLGSSNKATVTINLLYTKNNE